MPIRKAGRPREYAETTRERARELMLRKREGSDVAEFSMQEISRMLRVNRRTLYDWRQEIEKAATPTGDGSTTHTADGATATVIVAPSAPDGEGNPQESEE